MPIAEQFLHRFKAFSAFHPTSELRMQKDSRGTQLGQLIPAYPQDTPHDLVSCPEYKLGRRKKKGRRGMLGVIVFVFSSNGYIPWIPALLKMAEHLPAYGKG